MPLPIPRTGIIDSQVENDPIQDAPAPDAEPVTTQVDADNETVENRLGRLTSGESAYVRLNEDEAARQANNRGLINSSIAKGAGREAAIRSALPIAQQDSRTYTDTRFRNQDAENRFRENRQNTDLNKELAAQQSGLERGELTLRSELSREESAVQNDLQMQRDTHSAQLNESLATLESTLRENEMTLDSQLQTAFETHLSDQKFGDETKLRIVSNINSIVRDAQEQIVRIGLTDRSAAQQAKAIALVQANRDAQLAVYQDLLGTFGDWDWGTDFTPEPTPQSVAAGTPPPPKTTRSSDTRSSSQPEISCFIAGTKVICANGKEYNIEDVRIGDYVLGMGGEYNEVLAFDRPKLGDRQLYSINGGPNFVTSEHPFMSPTGWRSIDPDQTAKENRDLIVESLLAGDEIRTAHQGFVRIATLFGEDADPETQLYNFKLSGNNTYYANDYLVHNKGR